MDNNKEIENKAEIFESDIGEFANNLCTLIKEQFDKIVYIWNTTTGIHISTAFAEKLLKSYVANKGWRYYDSTYSNIPFMLMRSEPATNLVWRSIYKNSEIYALLQEKAKGIHFTDINEKMAKIEPDEHKNVSLSFYLTKHKNVVVDNELKETFVLSLTEDNKTIGEITINVDQSALQNLINIPDDKFTRNNSLLEMASRIIP